jgi:vacuolar protein sorting-associated protein 16
MDTLHPRAEWECVDDRWFRKTQLYTEIFDKALDLDDYVVTGAPYAGALGMTGCASEPFTRRWRIPCAQ